MKYIAVIDICEPASIFDVELMNEGIPLCGHHYVP